MIHSGNKQAAEMLKEFENLEALQADTGWEQQLFARIRDAKNQAAGQTKWRQYAVIIAIFLALNTLLFFRAAREDSARQEERTGILDTVSGQLLINSSASK